MTPKLELCYNDRKAYFRRFWEVLGMQVTNEHVAALLLALLAVVEAIMKVVQLLTAA